MQSLTDQISLMIRSQQPGPPPPVESGRHASGLWCVQCGQPEHIRQFCRIGQNRDQRNNGGPPLPNQRVQGQIQYRQGNNRSPPPRGQVVKLVRMRKGRNSIFFCGRWHAHGQCWSEGQSYGCSKCGGNHPSDECRQPDKVISMAYPVANPQEHARDNMRGARPQGGPPSELRPPNLYYDHGNARQTFHPPTELPTTNGYIPIQNRQGGPQHFDNRGQAPSTDPDPSNSQNVRFMDGITEPHHDESIPFQMSVGDEQGQWPPHTNVITYELRSLDDEVLHEAPALAVTTRAMRGKTPLEVGVEGQEEGSSEEGPNLSELDRVARVARRATRESEKENVILHDREGPNVIHDLEGSEMEEWEGPGIPLDEFDGVHIAKVEKSTGYDLWADLNSLKADITIGQLLEISPIVRKTLKKGMPITRRTRKVKTRVAARVQLRGGGRDVKAIDIEVMVVDKVALTRVFYWGML